MSVISVCKQEGMNENKHAGEVGVREKSVLYYEDELKINYGCE